MAVSASYETVDKAHRSKDLVSLFDRCFASDWNTQLIQGGEEPIYLPAEEPLSSNRLVFTRDYFSSALHEIAHWGIAGSERRKLEDYGYWYAPDGRSAEQQQAFEKVESRPQVLEWILAKACKRRFRVSLDNLHSPSQPAMSFKRAVLRDAKAYSHNGLPTRAALFYSALADYYGGLIDYSLLIFDIEEL